MIMAGPGDLLWSAAASASYNMILQLGFRLLTFVVNACILRYVSSEVLGVVNVRLTLLYTTIMFLSREAFKRACLSNTKDKEWRQIINLVWCAVPCAVLFSIVLSAIWLFCLTRPDPDRIPYYSMSVCLFSLATVIELTSEPLWLIGQSFLFVKLKVVIEGAMVTSRCFLSIVLVIYKPSLGVLGFSVAHLVGSCVFPLLYCGYFIRYVTATKEADRPDGFPLRTMTDLLPRIVAGKPTFGNLLNLTWSFFKQSSLKQILTEGERYAMTITNILNFSDQGTYDIVSNLGSLVARFVFFPIEDSAYLFFSQSLLRGEPIQKQKKPSLDLACSVLEMLLTLVTLIGLTITTFGYAYSRTLLHLYGGSLLSLGSGPVLLRWFCVYVSFIAVNGVTESFVFAAMSRADVDRYNKKMLLFSLSFLASTYFLASFFGSAGFILANCFNMILRIAHSLHYISKFSEPSSWRPLRGLMPNKLVLVMYFISFCVTAIVEVHLYERGMLYRLLHIIIGCICLLTVGVTIFFKEKKLVHFVWEKFIQKEVEKKLD